MNLIKSKSSIIALFFNGQLAHIINPWVLSVDYENETITVEKRNWYFIGINKNIIAFRFIRNIRVDEHLFGANISIKATGGWVEAKYLSKNDAETFKNSLFEYNKGRNNYIIFS
ncbi:hypothetical protein [Flavobacterium helocola]|uniref:YokE-like PH domain-containing protein n=1 Tax=Flavobacterium helocola TaxID=3139139 RepID=A0ABU9I6W5_9FLAO|nr:hypothetical protein [uncultured Flavobacterium sp.]